MKKETFINQCIKNGFNQSESEMILSEYMKRKILSYNSHDFYTMQHGIFMEREPMKKALHFYKNTPTQK